VPEAFMAELFAWHLEVVRDAVLKIEGVPESRLNLDEVGAAASVDGDATSPLGGANSAATAAAKAGQWAG